MSKKIVDKLYDIEVKKNIKDEKRNIYFEENGWQNVNVFNFENIETNTKIYGPSIIDSSFTTIVVDPNTYAFKDEKGSLIIKI